MLKRHGSYLTCLFLFLVKARARAGEATLGLALTLLVLWIVANDADDTVATDDLAVAADLLNRCTYFHDKTPCEDNRRLNLLLLTSVIPEIGLAH